MMNITGGFVRHGLAVALLLAVSGAGAQEAAGPADAAVAAAAAATSAVPPRVQVAGAVEAWSGDTTYGIGGRIRLPDGRPLRSRDPISELEFPMDITLGSLVVAVAPVPLWEFGARGAVSLTSDAGTVRDSDWGLLEGSDSVDVYSESDGALDAWEAEAWIRCRLPTAGPVRLELGVGYLRQELSYEVSNLVQSYPSSGGSLEPDVEPGLVATYDATFSLPYFDARAQVTWGRRADVTLRAAVFPFASVEDEDHHLLRDKVAKADDDGYGYMIDGTCRYRIAAAWFIEGGVSYRAIEADGWQEQADAGEPIGSIEHRIEQSLASARLAVGRML